MSHWSKACRQVLIAGSPMLAWLALPAGASAGVSVALTPRYQIITPGSDFTVLVDVTAAGSAFNGYDLVLSYDPNALTLLPAAPISAQQGCLMTGGCSVACGNTFHNFAVAGDSIAVTDVLLCNQVAVTGPGRLYQLRFHSASTPQEATIRFRHASFFNDGISVTPVTTAFTVIGIGIGLGVGDRPGVPAHAVRVEPNPSFGGVRFVTEDDAVGLTEANIVDLLGRVVRHLGPIRLGAQAGLAWDGRDAHGVRVPAGLYLVRIRRGDQVQNTRVMLLQ